MRVGRTQFPLYLDKKDIQRQIETIGMSFNRYNAELNSRTRKSTRFCCIALDKNKICSVGINRSKTAPNFKKYTDTDRWTTHAEIDMLLHLPDYEVKNITDIWIIHGKYQPFDSFPCELCFGYLAEKMRGSCQLHYFYKSKWRSSPIFSAIKDKEFLDSIQEEENPVYKEEIEFVRKFLAKCKRLGAKAFYFQNDKYFAGLEAMKRYWEETGEEVQDSLQSVSLLFDSQGQKDFTELLIRLNHEGIHYGDPSVMEIITSYERTFSVLSDKTVLDIPGDFLTGLAKAFLEQTRIV